MIRALALCFILAPAAAQAQGLTQADVLQGQFRPGWQMPEGVHMAAVHLRLAPEWKTYWRSPGDAGIPPSFDWSGSDNLRAVRFHWPAPKVFHLNGMQSVGYDQELVLPIEVVAQDPSRPVHLRAEMELGVCKDICMPAVLSLSTDLLPPGAPDATIKAALRARPASGAEAGLARLTCAIEPIADGLRITAQMDLPSLGREEAVVMEAGEPGIWVSEAVVRREGKRLTAVAEMVPPEAGPFSLSRDRVTLTVIGPAGRAVEIRGCPAAP